MATSVELIPSGETHNKAPQKCTHFSIRGYVSEVRKSDPTLCNPFPLKNTLKAAFCYELPPMEVPMFRWWQCVSCVSVSNEHAKAPLLLLEKSSKLNVEHPKGKGKALVQDEPVGPTAWGSGFDKDSMQGLLLLNTGNNEENSIAAKKETELGVRCNGQKNNGVNGLEAGPTQEYANHNGADHSLMNVVEVEVNELASTRNKSSPVNLPDLNECSGVPLFAETSEPMITNSYKNDVFCEDDDDCLGAECRKFPKFRLLSEISAKGRKKNHLVTNPESTTELDDVSEEIISTAMTKRRCKLPFIERKNNRSKLDHASSSEVGGKGKVCENYLQKTDITDRLIERSFVMTKKRGKQAMSFAPCKTQVLEDENAEKRSSEQVQKASKDGIKCSRSFINKRKRQPYVLEDGVCLPSSEAESMLVDGSRPENQNDVRETSTTENFENLLAEKSSVLAQDTSLQVSDSVSKQKEQTNKVRGHMHDIDINSIPPDDKVADDIPMDIVELMAKNQYERHLGVLNEKHGHPIAPRNSEKSTSDNGVDGNLGHFSDFDHRPPCILSFGQTKNPIAARLVYPMQGQKYDPSIVPPSGSSLNNWNVVYSMEKLQRYTPQFVQPLESYRIQPCTPRQNTNEGPHVYPSVVATRMPMGITNPQLIPRIPDVLNTSKIDYHQRSNSILAFDAPSPVRLGKQKNLDFSKSSAGSVNGYSKDANPVVHLSSMIQNEANMHNVADLSLAPPRQGLGASGPSSSRQTFVENDDRSSTIQETTNHQYYPTAIPVDHSFPWSFRNDAGKHGKSSSNTGFVSPISLTIRGKKSIESHQSRQVRFFEDVAPSIVLPGRVKHDESIFSPNPEKMICKLNQNPSEFNDLKQMSRYMIKPQDLRPSGTIREKLSRARGYSKKQDIKRFNKHNFLSKEREQ